jgi:uncharacterized protein (DUF934 family)
MAQLIKNQSVTVDGWKTLEIAAHEAAETIALPPGDVIFPLAIWQARKAEIISTHKRIGLLLQPGDSVSEIAADLEYFIVIAIDFPKFVDGRGYSIASLLRQRYQFEGELRAVGDVLHDQLFFMARVGFDSYALKDGKNVTHALKAGFSPFSDSYQNATNQPLPYFRRRAA